MRTIKKIVCAVDLTKASRPGLALLFTAAAAALSVSVLLRYRKDLRAARAIGECVASGLRRGATGVASKLSIASARAAIVAVAVIPRMSSVGSSPASRTFRPRNFPWSC